jgi:hypothetical protein
MPLGPDVYASNMIERTGTTALLSAAKMIPNSHIKPRSDSSLCWSP